MGQRGKDEMRNIRASFAVLSVIFIAAFVSNVHAQETSYELLWSYKTGGSIYSVSLSSYGSYIVAGSNDGNVYFLDREGELLWSYKTGGGAYGVSVSSDGLYIAARSADKNVYFFSREGKLLWSYKTGSGDYGVSSDGSYVVASANKSVYFFSREGELLWSYKTDGEAFGVSSDGSYVVASANKSVYFFGREGELLWSYKTSDEVWGVSVSSDGSYVVASGYESGNVYFFSREGKLLWSYKTGGGAYGVSVSSDGSYVVASGYESGNVYFFSREGKLLWSYNTGSGVFSVSVSSDGSYVVASGYESGNVYFFNREGELLWSYKTGGGAYGVSVSSDGSYIVAGSDKNIYFFSRKVSVPPTTTSAPTTQPPTTQPPTTIPATTPPQTSPPQAKVEVSQNVIYGIFGFGAVILAGALFRVYRNRRKRRALEPVQRKEIEPTMTEAALKTSSAIVVKGLSKRYKETTILNKISFELEQGKLCAVVGTSGGGKSTIIESIAGRITPEAGEIEILGKNVKTQREKLNELIGFVPQHPELYMEQSVWQNMMNSAIKWGVKGGEAKSEKILKMLGIYERKDVIAKNLSGGQLKRLSLGMELIREPPLLILDEPTTGLDPTSRDEILSALSRIVCTDKKTAIFTTHFMDEAEHCDEVIVIGSAKILAKGEPSELARKLPGMGKIVQVTLEEVSQDMVSKISKINGVKKVIREGRVLKIIMDSPEVVKISQKIEEFGGVIEESKIAKAGMKEVFVYYTGEYPEEKK